MTTVEFLKQTRLRLTLVYAAVMAAVLLAFSALVISADTRVRSAEMDQDLQTQAQRGAAALFVDEEGRVVAERFVEDGDLTNAYPQLWAIAATDDGIDVLVGPEDDYFPEADLEGLALAVLYDGELGSWYIWGGEDQPDLRARGVALVGADEDQSRAAVIAIADEVDWMDGHARFRNQVLASAGLLVLVSGVAGYFLAGRSLRPAEESIHQQERLIADAAHELRTPVARIRAVAEGGLEQDEAPDVALKRVADISIDAGVLIDDLLALARMDAGQQTMQRERLRLDLLAEQVAADLPEVRVEAVPTEVEGDARLLGRAIANLAANAVQHGRRDDPDVAVTITVYPTRVIVEDAGPGMDPAVRAAPFERFRTGQASEGHGLGLPIVHWIAHAHNGSVNFDDRSGGGTTAILDLEG